MAANASTVKPQTKAPTFDGARLAHLEVAGLRAYYDRRWLDCFRFILRVNREQFGLSLFRAIQSAYYITRASIVWAPVDHKAEVTHDYIRKFYRVAKSYGNHGMGLPFDSGRVADIEFEFWTLHRERGNNPNNDPEPYIRCVTNLHSAIFGLTPEQTRYSGEKRVDGTDAIDRITGKRSTDIDADWQTAESALSEAYRSIAVQL